MKIDPYKNKERWLKWKEKTQLGIEGLSPVNSNLIIQYLTDMEKGINIASCNVKGSRSYIRLNSLKTRMIFLLKQLESKYKISDAGDVTEEQILDFFSSMRSGELKTRDGRKYKSVQDYAKIFKAFWHWYQKTRKKQGKEVIDITVDLDTSGEKPEWVYLNEEQFKKLCDNAKYEYKVLMMFLFDSGIRAPTELINIKVSDLFNDCKELYIRDEISKTFGRRIKLMICSELIKEFIKNNKLKPDNYLFPIVPYAVNRYLNRLGERVLGKNESLAGQKYSDLTMYDFRHNSCCYWLPKYKSESALKYRFGWKSTDKIHYYSELLGMKDTISEDELKLLQESGCSRILIGAESGNEDELKYIEKGMTTTDVLEVAKRLGKVGIHGSFTVIVGYPGFPDENILRTLEFGKRIASISPLHEVKAHVYAPYPGTPLYQDAIRHGFVPPKTLGDWANYDYYEVQTPWLREELTQEVREFNKNLCPYVL